MIVYVVYNNDADEKLKEEQKKNPKDWIVVSDLYYPDFTR